MTRRGKSARPRLRIQILGGCLVAGSESIIKDVGRELGFDAEVTATWPTQTSGLAPSGADITIFQASINDVLSPLWDCFPFLSDREKLSRLSIIKKFISERIEHISSRLKSGVLLVHGVSDLQMPPAGRCEFRQKVSFSDVIHELNNHIRKLIAGNPDAILIDEERLVANEGRSHLMDDLYQIYSHHGPLYAPPGDAGGGAGKGAESPRFVVGRHKMHLGPPVVGRIFAREYFDCYLIWKGLQRIKCVIVDLDNTLWHGVVGETEPVVRPIFQGIHQALAILKSRGVLLATCSRNDHAQMMKHWRALKSDSATLRPDDFVIHQINWDKKSKNVRVILERLGLSAESSLFIDDNPVERAEVARAHPGIRLLGDKITEVRRLLLTDPRLQSNVASAEALKRTEMTRGQLTRDEARKKAPNADTFLRSIGVELKIARIRTPRHLPRIAELFQRTTQFNATLAQFSARSLEQLTRRSDAAVYALSVRDKFVDYGLVGACVIANGEVSNVAVSCRVLALDPARAFVSSILVAARLNKAGTTARIVEGPRNFPARTLYKELGFEPTGGGRFALKGPNLKRPPAGLYKIKLVDESLLSV